MSYDFENAARLPFIVVYRLKQSHRPIAHDGIDVAPHID